MILRLLILTALLILAAPAGIHAQTVPDGAIYLWALGDLYAADASGTTPPVALTQDGTISEPVISPDGRWIAYRSAASAAIEALGRLQMEGFIADFDLPTDIFLLDTTTGQSQRFAAQPADVRLFVEGQPDNAIVRSSPAWAADGAVVWVEFNFGASSGRLIRVDLAAAQITTLSDTVVIGAQGRAPSVRAGRGSVAIITDSADSTEQTLVIYDAAGAISGQAVFQPADGAASQFIAWASAGDDERLAILSSDGRWTLYDANGQIVSGAEPYLTGTAPDALIVRIGHVPDAGFFWEAVDPQQPDAASQAFPAGPTQIALSPDGRALASLGYPSFGGVGLWRGEAITGIPATGGEGEGALFVGHVLWSAPVWVIAP